MSLLHCINSLFPVQSTSNFKATQVAYFFKLNQQYVFCSISDCANMTIAASHDTL